MHRRYGSVKFPTVRDFSPLHGNFPDRIRLAAAYVDGMRSHDVA